MILVTLALPLGALLLMHAMQLLEAWALQEAQPPGRRTGSDGAAAGGSTAAPQATTP